MSWEEWISSHLLSLPALGQLWIKASSSSEKDSYTYRGSSLTCYISSFVVYHCLCDCQSPSLMPSPVSGFATCQSESQVRLPAPWAEPPWVPVVVLPSLHSLPLEMKTILTSQPCAIHGSATCPTEAQGLSKRVGPTGTQSIVVGFRNRLFWSEFCDCCILHQEWTQNTWIVFLLDDAEQMCIEAPLKCRVSSL